MKRSQQIVALIAMAAVAAIALICLRSQAGSTIPQPVRAPIPAAAPQAVQPSWVPTGRARGPTSSSLDSLRSSLDFARDERPEPVEGRSLGTTPSKGPRPEAVARVEGSAPAVPVRPSESAVEPIASQPAPTVGPHGQSPWPHFVVPRLAPLARDDPEQGPTARGRGPRRGVAEKREGPGAESPTGHRPKAIWTPQRQALWNHLSHSGDPEWAHLIRSAGATGTKGQRYADLGQWASVAYQLTGNPSYAEKAWLRIMLKIGKRPPNRNFTRAYFIEYAWMYDWLKPALTEEQRQQYIAMMNEWCRLVLDRVPGVPWGTRTSDSDETVGHYFGLALWAAVSGAENPEAVRFLNDRAVGGYDATGINRSTWRNTIREYVKKAKGGVWIESSKYNLGTIRLLLFGAEALRTATGQDHFPEISALIDDIATAQLHDLTSDLRQSYQWGDEEDPRSLHMDRRAPLLAMLSGLATDEAVAGRTLALLNELPRDEIPPKELVLYNPTRPPRNWRNQPTAYLAQGVGLLYARDGWEAHASFFGAYMPNRLGIDHEVRYLGDFQLYRNGEWALTHPLGYDANEAEYTNTMLLAGWSAMREARGLIGSGMTDDGICYVIGATGGHPYLNGDHAPPPYFLHEWTRSLVYVPSRDRSSDVIIVHDRTLVQNPQRLPHYDGYSKRFRSRMDREIALGLKQWILHMPEAPTLHDHTVTWQTPGGQPVQLITLLPAQVTYRVLDEKTQLHMGKYVRSSEKGWQLRVSPVEEREWDTFLHVIHVGAGRVEVTFVQEGDLEGIKLVRPGHPDRTVLFNAKPSQKLPAVNTLGGNLVYDRALLKRYQAFGRVEIRSLDSAAPRASTPPWGPTSLGTCPERGRRTSRETRASTPLGTRPERGRRPSRGTRSGFRPTGEEKGTTGSARGAP